MKIRPSKSLLAFVSLALLLTPAYAAESPLKTFLLIGQSNMVGRRCQVEELPDHLKASQENVLFFHPKEGWQPITPGKTQAEGLGPEFSFGYELQKLLEEPLGIIKLSVGGTNLHTQWDPKLENSLYHRTLALSQRAAEARPIEIVGVVWVQGGADSKRQEDADAYAVNYREFINAWRKDLENPRLAVVCGRCGTTTNPERFRAKKPFIDTVRGAQMGLEDPIYTWVDLDDITLQGDAVHFDTPGMVETGVRYAKAMRELLNGLATD